MVIKNLLSEPEVTDYKAKLKLLSGLDSQDWRDRHFQCPNGVSTHPQFWSLIFHDSL